MILKTAGEWITELGLKRHPEGGWFRRIYESEQMIGNTRPVMTSIYYLLEGSDFSALHRLKQDEQWHFYSGHPVTIHIIAPDGAASEITLRSEGPFQTTIRAGYLFGATVDGDYSLVGCTVAPGFDYADFELPSRTSLLETYPQHKALIHKLARE